MPYVLETRGCVIVEIPFGIHFELSPIRLPASNALQDSNAVPRDPDLSQQHAPRIGILCPSDEDEGNMCQYCSMLQYYFALDQELVDTGASIFPSGVSIRNVGYI